MVQPDPVIAPGDPVGQGRTAEVFALDASEVLKLLRPDIPDAVGEHEATVAALVGDAGVAAPRFLGTTRVDGRYGIRYERVDGPSMLERLSARPFAIDGLARRFAELHAAMHDHDGTGLPASKDALRRAMDRAGDVLPEEARHAALARLEVLPDGGAICHGDMHPGNVLLTGRGPIVIDWMTATMGDPAADVARTLFLLRESGVPGYMGRLERSLIAAVRRRFSSVYRRRYRSLRPIDDAALRAWRLPVLAARLGEWIEAERPTVLAAIARELEGDLASGER